MGAWDDVRWFVVFTGAPDAFLWTFEADGWLIDYRPPTDGMLAIVHKDGSPPATVEDARWLADAMAFDHDAPIGVFPVNRKDLEDDPEALPHSQPVHPFEGEFTRWYWEHQQQANYAAAELRFNGSYVLRYEAEPGQGAPGELQHPAPPTTNFSARFEGREELVGLYGMAARQPDLLSEYLFLYRVLEGADGTNGTRFSAANIGNIAGTDFGELRVAELGEDPFSAPNAFDVYRDRAIREIENLGDKDIPKHLYGLRNGIAHGKYRALTQGNAERLRDAAAALPIVKLLARLAIDV